MFGFRAAWLMKDEKDHVVGGCVLELMMYFSLIVLCTIFEAPWWVCAPMTVFTMAVYLERYMLLIHFTSHNVLFKSRAFELFAHHILCQFLGLPAYAYYRHHVIMHHGENNVMPYDLSSTMGYNRG